MKRKIILMGKKTFVVSLPMRWVKRYNLSKGEELMVAEKESSLLITNAKNTNKASIEVKVGDKKLLRQYATDLYRLGYDELTLFHKNLSSELEKILPLLPGMEIIEETSSYCRLKSLALEENNDFENLLRRLFFVLSNLKLKSGKELINTKETALKLLNYLYRMLYKRENGSHQRTLLLASLLHELENTLKYGEKQAQLTNLYDSYYNYSKELNLDDNRIAQIAFALQLENQCGKEPCFEKGDAYA